MKFRVIEEADIVHPGEYLLHTPTQQIVMCGAFMRDLDKIKVLANGKLLEDNIKKYTLTMKIIDKILYVKKKIFFKIFYKIS